MKSKSNDDRRVFYVDVKGMSENKTKEFLQNFLKAVRPIVDKAFIGKQKIIVEGVR